MLLFDLQRLLFGFLVVLIVAVAVAVWLDRRLRRNQRPEALPGMGEVRPVLERAPFGCLVLEGRRTCRYANPYARQLLDLATPSVPLPEAEWVHCLNEDRLAVRLETTTAGRYRTVPLPSDQIVRWWVVPWGDRDLVFLLDTTAQQRAEQAARFLLSDLSHELRTPLATILTHLEVLHLSDISEDTGQQSLRLLKEEAQRMARLVNDMLELGRLETTVELERRPVDLLALAQDVVPQVTSQAEERAIDVSLEADAPLPLVIGDPDRLRQVFLNLLDNAINYSRPGDRVVISLQRVQAGVECMVRDTGPGIPVEHLPHVTRRFYRVAPQEAAGSGLGLALAAEILRRHQSRLEIESRTEGEGRGTRVRFVLPEVPADEGGEDGWLGGQVAGWLDG
jgi:two-component system phosphate regulon sensor histidine kinase PhoR